MEITAVETIALTDLDIEEEGWVEELSDDYRRVLFVRVHTDEGHVGLGETYPRPHADAEVIHRHIAPEIVGSEASAERVWRDIYRPANVYGGYGGAEMRALSAVDIALWDLAGKAAGMPIYELLGGPVRDSLRTYNTCYEDEYDFMEEPVELAADLLDAGIGAMKIWPYDGIAYRNGGQYISPAELKEGAAPLRAIKEEFGDRMDVAMEFHGLWNVDCAKRIARHLEAHDPMWLEELIEIGDVTEYDAIARATSLPVIASERLMTKYDFRHLFDAADVDIAMMDIEWMGGITEARKAAAIAESYQRPIAPHNAGGPVLHFANLHLGASVPNLMIQESIRGRYDGWHAELVTDPAGIEDGRLQLPEGPGLGTELSREVLESEDAIRRRTTASRV